MIATTFRYRALRPTGVIERGELDAADRPEAMRSLASAGLLLLEMEETRTRPRVTTMSWPDLALGLRLMANLLRAGLPMDRALAAFAETAPGSWCDKLPPVAEAVRQGQSLGAALAAPMVGVPSMLSGIIRAGEVGGGAAEAVKRAADVAESIAASSAALRAALVYPVVLFTVGLSSLGFLVLVVLPRFAAILAGLGQGLPPVTRLVLAGAQLTGATLVPGAAVAAIVLLIWSRLLQLPGYRARWHRSLLRLPLIGPLRHSFATARASEVLGALLESAVPLPRALRHTSDASSDFAVAAALDEAREDILQGTRPSSAFAASNALTPTALRLVRSGEDTGQLGAMLREAARLERDRAERMVRRTILLVEPAFILCFGGLVAIVAAALLQALYGIRP